MKKILFATAASAALLVTPAFAQEAPQAPTGPRVEAIVGYDKVKGLGESDEGVLFGIGAGYDHAVTNRLSLGVDVEASNSTQEETIAGLGNISAGRDLYAGARATFAVTPTVNLYAKGGYTNARFKFSDGVNSASDNLDGWRIGAGAQANLVGKTYAGAEYRYSNYDGDLKRNQVVLTLGTRF